MNVVIDHDLCILRGACVQVCPAVFEIVVDTAVAAHPEKCTDGECCEEDAKFYPLNAIELNFYE